MMSKEEEEEEEGMGKSRKKIKKNDTVLKQVSQYYLHQLPQFPL
jgi:flagellar biosynthesis chaperone FliJ